MDVISVSPEMDRRRETFFRILFGEHEGYVCVAHASRDRKNFREEYFKFPDQLPELLGHVNTIYQGHNVWFCPQLLDRPKREKQYVITTPNAWSDLDTLDPKLLDIEPTILVESSGGRYQGYWVFDRAVDPDDAENISQRIAYKHADDGADRSGWDLTQLLRMPYTYNYKYATSPIVMIIEANRRRFRLSDFEEKYPQVTSFSYTDLPMPEEVPDGEEMLTKNRLSLNPTIWRLFQEERPANDSWSEHLWKLEMLLFEAGWVKESVFAVVRDAKCNKYAKKGMADKLLWKDVCRAEAKYKQQVQALAAKPTGLVEPLLSDEERADLAREDTFIERYIEWAKSLGDAAPQYHQAGAFIALSALLAGSVQLPTSFGTIKPNLWFMILADTTLTRKSTAMDIAMDLVMEIDDDVIMATDGSIEGLLTSLSTRPGRPSVFLRDEFSGLLEAITKKDYYAGMPELLTKLYDGKMQKRILRKESIDVRDPCLLLFAGGIKNKITSLLSHEHVSSGFMPRFVFITAESDITRVRPLGPPTTWIDDNRSAIRNELTGIAEYYTSKRTMVIKGTKFTQEVDHKHDAELTEDAWWRYNKMEQQMLDEGIRSERPDILTPVGDRLAKSILKAAVLLAASRQKEEKVLVEESDIVRAIGYGENWRTYAREVMSNIGKGAGEKLLDNILGAITNNPGVSRSQLMQSYHLTARDANQVFTTLEERNLIDRTKAGRGEVFYPATIRITPKESA